MHASVRATPNAGSSLRTILQNTHLGASTGPDTRGLQVPRPRVRRLWCISRESTTEPPLYGLDIETDTTVDGLDPAVASIVGVAIVGPGVELVLDGSEYELLVALDRAVAALTPGVLVTWNGSGFDLPFLDDRARLIGVDLGLRITHDPSIALSRNPLLGHPGAYRGRWYHHRHLDGYRLYRSEIDPKSGLSCGLKSLARHFGLPIVEVERDRIHELDRDTLRRYVTSDAALARELVARRWSTAQHAIDPIS